MKRLFAVLVLIGAPALAREVRGRVAQAEEGSEEARKLAGGAMVLRMSVESDDGKLVTLNAQDGITQVFEGSLAQVRVNSRIRATVDDDCNLDSGLCVAAQIGIEKPAGLTRIEAVKEHVAEADQPDMKALGASREDPRDFGEPARRRFIKGELTNLGSDKLVLADSRFGLRTGVARLDNSIYLAVAPELDLHFGDWMALGLGLPLNVRAYADGFYDTHKIKFRENDYSQAADYARILRFLTIGRKEDQLYLNVSPLFAASIGHGAIVRRYNANIESPQEPFGYDKKVGAEVDAYGRYGGFEAFTGDVMHPSHFVAGLAFVKPLGWLTGPSRDTLGWTSIGLSTAVDFAAPYALDRGPNGYPQVGDTDVCPQPGVDYCQPDDPIARETRRAQVVGVDLETKVVKTDNADVKPYLDYSRLLDIQNPDPGARGSGGGGWTLGVLGRFSAGSETTHAFRLVGELRYFDGNYLPGYFDTFYEVQKFQFITGKADTGYEPKLRTVLDRDPAHKRGGYYLEAAYQYNGGFAVMAAYEDSFHLSGPDSICFGCTGLQQYVGSRNLTLHVEYPAYSWLQFFASYYRRSFDGGPLASGQPLGDNTLIYGAARVHVLWIFFLNARVFRSWRPDPVLGEMRNLWGGDFDLEVGYEFDRSRH